jgi:tetratricopeptide (TPR) repeat protein
LWQLTQQGQDLLAAGDLAGAEAAFADVLALVERDLPDEALTWAAALHNLAAVRADLGQLVQAEAMARAALDIRRRLGEAGAIASSERLLGTILHDLGQLDEARAMPMCRAFRWKRIWRHWPNLRLCWAILRLPCRFWGNWSRICRK